MATINLGAIKFNWKGAFNNSTAYAVDDVVSSGGNSYVCIQASQGNAVGNATAYWNIMSAAGTNGSNGTDLSSLLSTRGDLVFKNASALARLPKGTEGQVLGQGANDPAWVNGSAKTLTTQGDLLYRDGSGLQRLAKGTAAQTLQMNSGANAPTWTTVAAASADWVKVGSTNVSSGVTLMSLNYFSSTYNTYRIIGRDIKGDTTGNGALNFRVNVGGNASTSDQYSSAQYYVERGSSTSSGHQGEYNQGILNLGAWDMPDLNNNNAVWYIDMTFYNVNTSKYKVASYKYGGIRNGGAAILDVSGSLNTTNTSALTGITLYKSNSTLFTGGRFTVYGLKE